MKEIVEAIKSRWDNSSLSDSITGGIWHGKAPDGQSMPYCIFNEISNTKRDSTRTKYYHDFVVQFDVFTDDGDPSTSGALADLVWAAFDHANNAQTSPLQSSGTTRIAETSVAVFPSTTYEGGDTYRTYQRLRLVLESPKTPYPG